MLRRRTSLNKRAASLAALAVNLVLLTSITAWSSTTVVAANASSRNASSHEIAKPKQKKKPNQTPAPDQETSKPDDKKREIRLPEKFDQE